MGNCYSRTHKKKVTLGVLGLDNAGKTSVVKCLTAGSLADVAPTVGFNSVDFLQKPFLITLYDLGGGLRIRDIWRNYYPEIFGVVFVVDASDERRVEEVRQCFSSMVDNLKLKGKPILLLLNKQDCDGALDEVKAADRLNLAEIVNKNRSPCRVETCVATKGTGKRSDASIRAGFKWLIQRIEEQYAQLSARVVLDVREMKAQQQLDKQQRLRRIQEARDNDSELESDAVQNGPNGCASSPNKKSHKNRDLPFRPLPDIMEEAVSERSAEIQPKVTQPKGSVETNGGPHVKRTGLVDSGSTVPRLPPISPQILRKLPPLHVQGGSPSHHQRRDDGDLMDRRSSEDISQHSDVTHAKKRKRRRLQRFVKVSSVTGSDSDENSQPSNTAKPETLAHFSTSEPAPVDDLLVHFFG